MVEETVQRTPASLLSRLYGNRGQALYMEEAFPEAMHDAKISVEIDPQFSKGVVGLVLRLISSLIAEMSADPLP